MPTHQWKLYWWPRHYSTIGRRGTVLLLLGVIWILTGLDVLIRPEPSAEELAQLLHLRWPAEIRSAGWILTGMLAVAIGVRPPRRGDQMGWLALYVMPAERAFSFIWSWLDYYLPLGNVGSQSAVGGALVYLAILGIILTCSKWPDPPPPPEHLRVKARLKEPH
jgi:hypothetical protein